MKILTSASAATLALITLIALSVPRLDLGAAELETKPVKRAKPARATARKSVKAKPAAASTSRPSPKRVDRKVLWDNWYTITINKTIKYAYYHERVELVGDRLRFLAKTWKKEEGFLNEEDFGGFASNKPSLDPLFYNIRSTYRSTETRIDGTVKNGKDLHVRTIKGNTELPMARRFLPDDAIFSVFFPLWVGKNLNELKKGKTMTFRAVFEDDLESGFRVETGRVRMAKPDGFAKKTKTHRIAVQIAGISQTYWVRDSGAAIRVIAPKLRTLQQLVSRDQAQKFFDEF